MVIQRGNMKRSRCFVEGTLFCRSGLFVLLFLFPLSLLCRSLTLYDFSKSPDPALIQSYDGAWKWLSEAGRLEIELGPKGDWPSVHLKPSSGRWDLGNCAVVGADVWNTGTETSRIGLRVDNPEGNGNGNCVQTIQEIPAGEHRRLEVEIRLCHKVLHELTGMRGKPEEIGGSGSTWRRLNDPSNVVRVLVFAVGNGKKHKVEVGNIVASGERKPERYNPKLAGDAFFPFIDQFGQFIHRDWPGKVKDQQDLEGRLKDELTDLKAHPGAEDWNKWGGWESGPTLKATGFFRTEKINGWWWLVDPDGKLFFSYGMDSVTEVADTPVTGRESWFSWLPPKEPRFKGCHNSWTRAPGNEAYRDRPFDLVDFGLANIIRKYGPEWRETHAERAHLRLRSWGVNTIGNWSRPEIYLMRKTPYFATVQAGGADIVGGKDGFIRFPDVFGSAYEAKLRKAFEKHKGQAAGDPWCVGFFVDNELRFGLDDRSLGAAVVSSAPQLSTKQEMIRLLRAKHDTIEALNGSWKTGFESWDALLANRVELTEEQLKDTQSELSKDLRLVTSMVVDMYFKTVRRILKEFAPDNLYAGSRFMGGRGRNDLVERIAAKYCDIVSYNVYAMVVDGWEYADFDAPIICGEFHFGALDRGMFHGGCRLVESQLVRGEKLKEYVDSAFRHPRFVGCHWFKYRDQMSTGRTLDGENYQVGFVDVADTPYIETVSASRQVGYGMYNRLAAIRNPLGK